MSSAQLGSVSSIHRYAVKSLRGEEVRDATATTQGLAGDRLWAFRDVRRRELASAKHNPGLLQIEAIVDGESGHARVVMPDGTSWHTSDRDLSEHVSGFLGKQVTLHPLRPATETSHYARNPIAASEFEAYAREFFALTDDEPLPDLSNLPPEAITFTSLPGTYFDVLPLHIVLLSEFQSLCKELPGTNLSLARFRPNVVIDDLAHPLKSSDLVGKTLRIGSVIVTVKMTTPRCAMTTHEQGMLPKAPEIMRRLVAVWRHSFGVYASIDRGGALSHGAPVLAHS